MYFSPFVIVGLDPQPQSEEQNTEDENGDFQPLRETRSQAVARIADRTAKNCRGHVT